MKLIFNSLNRLKLNAMNTTTKSIIILIPSTALTKTSRLVHRYLSRIHGPDKDFRPYEGPLIVVAHDKHNNHIVRTPGGGGAVLLRRFVPLDQLKPVIDAIEFDTIKSIHGTRVVNDKTQYKVRLFGKRNFDWYNEEDIFDDNLLQVYNQKRQEFESTSDGTKEFVYYVKRHKLKEADLYENYINALGEYLEDPDVNLDLNAVPDEVPIMVNV